MSAFDAPAVIEQARRRALAADGIITLPAERPTDYPTVRAANDAIEHVLETLASEVEDARHSDDPASVIADRIEDLLNETRGR